MSPKRLTIAGLYSPEKWALTGRYCPQCGKQSVWCEQTGGGDFYHGERFICVGCSAYFHLPGGVNLLVKNPPLDDKKHVSSYEALVALAAPAPGGSNG